MRRVIALKICPHCGRSLQDAAAFCAFCGAKQPLPAPEPPTPPETVVCPACGAEQAPDAQFCAFCGAKIQAAPPAVPPAAPDPDGAAPDAAGEDAAPAVISAEGMEAPPSEDALPVLEETQSSGKRRHLVRVLVPAVLAVLALFFGWRELSFRQALARAERFVQEENLSEAVSSYQEALSKHPGSRDAALGLADAYLRSGAFSDAAALLEELSVPEGAARYEEYETLRNTALFQPEIREVETENFPVMTVTLAYEGGLVLTKDDVTVSEDGERRPVTELQMGDGRLVLTYTTADSDRSDEKREVDLRLQAGEIPFRRSESYRTPHFEPAQVRLVSTDVSQYPVVKAYFRVEDPATGQALEGLGKKSFVIRERLQGGEYLAREVRLAESLEGRQGLNIDLVADKSDSISENDMAKIKKVMGEFVGKLHYEVGDRAEVLAFDSIVQQMCAYTSDSLLLKNGIDNMSTDGMTAFYDAVYDGIHHAALQGGARCVIAFTDGIDNRSRHTAADVIAYSDTMQVPVYIIGVSSSVETSILRSVAQSTGGRYWFIDDLYDLQEIFDEIYAEQKKLYAVEYESGAEEDPYALRELEVTVSGGGYRAKEQTRFQAAPSVGSASHSSRYELIKEALTWEEATRRCQERGGHLATITSQAEMDQLTAMADAQDVRFVWLGGYTSYDDDGSVFGHWVTGEPFSFEAWCVDEPSRVDLDGTEEWYIMLWNIPSLGGWTWNDQRNDPLEAVASMDQHMGFICEYEN